MSKQGKELKIKCIGCKKDIYVTDATCSCPYCHFEYTEEKLNLIYNYLEKKKLSNNVNKVKKEKVNKETKVQIKCGKCGNHISLSEEEKVCEYCNGYFTDEAIVRLKESLNSGKEIRTLTPLLDKVYVYKNKLERESYDQETKKLRKKKVTDGFYVILMTLVFISGVFLYIGKESFFGDIDYSIASIQHGDYSDTMYGLKGMNGLSYEGLTIGNEAQLENARGSEFSVVVTGAGYMSSYPMATLEKLANNELLFSVDIKVTNTGKNNLVIGSEMFSFIDGSDRNGYLSNYESFKDTLDPGETFEGTLYYEAYNTGLMTLSLGKDISWKYIAN